MFTRVSQALSRFVKPIASSAAEASAQASHSFQPAAFPRKRRPEDPENPEDQKPGDPTVFQQHPEHPQKKLAQVIRLPEKKGDGPPPHEAGTNVTIPHAFVLLFREFHQRRHEVMRWMGRKAYSATAQNRPRGYRKGAMLDQKAE